MTSPSISLTDQMLRRRPVIGAPVAHGASDHLKRSIGTFQLAMFGVGATVGTGIFFVLSQAVPEAGPGVIISFLIAGVAAGLAAICYAEMASAVPVSCSTYSYAYTTWANSSRWEPLPAFCWSTASRLPRSRWDGASTCRSSSRTSSM
jgi:amino acid permease